MAGGGLWDADMQSVGTHHCALEMECVGEDHICLPVLDLEEAGALGRAAILGGGLLPRGRGLEKERKKRGELGVA